MPDRNLVGLVHNPRVPKAAELVYSLVKSLDLEGSSWVSSSAGLEVSDETLAGTRAIITAGGDGTILRVVRIAAPHSVPILGINLGRVGFMAELTVGEAAEKVPQYLDGSPRAEERIMLQASVGPRSGGAPHLVVHALNDVVVTRGAIVRLLDIETRIDGVLLTTYRADGVIAATPTGSTGYALSAGGPILYPEAKELLLQPIAAHMSFQTGIVISADSVIELRVNSEHDAVLSVDGSSDTVLKPDDGLTIRKSPHSARFLRKARPAEFYATLTQGLGVSGRQVPQRPAL